MLLNNGIFKVRSFFCHLVKWFVIFTVLTMPFEQVVYASNIDQKIKTNRLQKIRMNEFHSKKNIWKGAVSHSSGFAVSPPRNFSTFIDNNASLPSNANNFHGASDASVDPRTGSASFSLPVASTLFDNGQDKRNLVLSYSGGPAPHGSNFLGLGSHWSFNIGLEHVSASEVSGHKTIDLTTSDGHSFTMESDRNVQGHTVWHPLRHKLGDITITGNPGDWTIATATGVREHLLFGYEDWEEVHDGKRIWFYYDRHGNTDIKRRLLYICSHPLTYEQVSRRTNQCQYNGIWITYKSNAVIVHGSQTIVIHTNEINGEPSVRSINLPSLSTQGITNSDQTSSYRFTYDDQGGRSWLIKTITEPSNQTETFLYNNESDRNTLQPQGLPVGFNRAHIPVVTETITMASLKNRDSVPTRRIWYRYSEDASNLHNYTGYLSGVSNEPGKDNLLDRADNYTYTVSQDNGLTSTTTTYNKYHLPLTVTQTDDLHHALIAKNDVTYSPWKNTTFTKLPPTYSLPGKMVKTLYSLATQRSDFTTPPARIVQQKQYDNNGQIIWQKDAYGRQTYTQYCPPKGDNHCPEMDPNWPQITLPEKVLYLPSEQTPTGSSQFTKLNIKANFASAVEIVFNYKLVPVSQQHTSSIKQYRTFLQYQRDKARKGDKHFGCQNGCMYRKSLLDHIVGEDNSALAGEWHVVTKSIGMLSPDNFSNLKPGQVLPELSQSQLSTITSYHYDLDQNSPTYNQLRQLRVIKYNHPSNFIHLIKTSSSYPYINGSTSQQITFNVTQHIDSKNHIRTTDIEVAPHQTVSHIINASRLLKASDSVNDAKSLSMGKSVYSLINGDRLSSDDTLKNLHKKWVYDVWQRPIKEMITPATGGKPQTISWTYISNSDEQSVVQTIPNGSQEKTMYAGGSNNQKILSTWHRDRYQAGLPMQGTSNWIENTSITYTQTDQPASKTVYHAADNNGKTIALTTRYGYDTLNRLIWQQSPNGTISVTVRNDPNMLLISYNVVTDALNQHDKTGQILSVVQSNVLGKPIAQYTFALNPATKINGKFVYSDKLKATLKALQSKLVPVNMLTTLKSSGLLPLSGENGVFSFVSKAINASSWITKTTTQYDGNGHRIEQTLPNGAKTLWKWKRGNLIATITPDGNNIHDSYNIQGNKILRCVQPRNQTYCHVLGTREYDDQDNLIWQADEYGKKITYTYDADGRMLTMTMPATKENKMHVFSYKYNSFAKVSASIDGVVYITYTYNPTTWQLTDKEDNISHLHYDYDPNTGFLIKINRSAPVSLKSSPGIDYPAGTETMTYDRYGQVMRVKDLAGNIYFSIHDKYGRVILSKVILPKKTTPTQLLAITYDTYFNRVAQVTNGIGIKRRFFYDDLGNLQTVTDKKADKILQQLSYTYNPQTKNISSITRSEGNDSATQTFSYDKKTNSLTAMSCNFTGKPEKISLLCPRDTDISGSQLTSPPLITSQHYTFDSWNNIKTVREKLVDIGGSQIIKTTTYTYEAKKNNIYDPHRIVSFITVWQSNKGSQIRIKSNRIIYDNLGRITKDANGNRLHYNAFGYQDGFINIKTNVHTLYTYDSAGHQVAEQSFDSLGKPLQQPLYMLYQNNFVTEQVQNDNKGKTNVSVELAGVAHSENGRINRWYVHDYKGDVISTFSSAGKKISDHVYSPYGMDDNLLNNVSKDLHNNSSIDVEHAWWAQHTPGFDGHMLDPASGYQFLGSGYRAYNPVYRVFMSHDSYSPFKKIDGYDFGDNNPIMNTDPSGHLPKWAGYLMGALGVMFSIASAILSPVVAAGVAIGASATGTVTNSLVATGIFSGVSGTIGVTTGTLQIASTALPNNKGLSIASQAFGITDALTSFGRSIAIVTSGISSALKSLSYTVSGFVISSGVTGAIASVTNEVTSGIGIAMQVNGQAAQNRSLASAINILSYVSMGFMLSSLMSSIGSGVAAKFTQHLYRRPFVPIQFTQNCIPNSTIAVLLEMQEESNIPDSNITELMQYLTFRKNNHYIEDALHRNNINFEYLLGFSDLKTTLNNNDVGLGIVLDDLTHHAFPLKKLNGQYVALNQAGRQLTTADFIPLKNISNNFQVIRIIRQGEMANAQIHEESIFATINKSPSSSSFSSLNSWEDGGKLL